MILSSKTPRLHVSVLDWWVGREPTPLLLVLSPSVLAYYPGLVIRGLEADKVHLWRIEVT